MVQVAVLKEQEPGENRVALVPAGVTRLRSLQVHVLVEAGAGSRAGYRDEDYAAAGAVVSSDPNAIREADIVLVVRPPLSRLDQIKPRAVIIGLLSPLGNQTLVDALCQRNLSGIAMELVPRITRAQSMDALSSQANIAGYKSVLLAAATAPRLFPMLMTAAGTIQPARVFVIGAGVA
ncbi:MAG: NAD(P)(+) transhydrogenase (Re/Si-specific) subunit alpha, partial [Phycisphaerae bacterium]|nr:NAD(P)(+) transhydrogenase (Re/Si-specific) subunit alpha [Phycisphaerae bacterium]MDW8263575.1 hypothetical protein [Phycisphaerales bacterium]